VTAVLLGLAWAAVVVAGIAATRPHVARIDELRTRSTVRRVGPTEVVGGLLLRLARRPTRDAARTRRIGRAAVAAVVPFAVLSVPLAPVVAATAALGMWWLPVVDDRRAERRRLARIESELPEVVDLLVLAVGAGLTVGLALDAVAQRADGHLAAELDRVVASTRQGHRLADALDTLPTRAGEGVRPFVAALVASERYGAPLAAGLERLAAEVRATRRRRADEAARRVSVKLLFPLVLCILPAFALLTVAPLIAGALKSLRL
jgi:tight adherence protein C